MANWRTLYLLCPQYDGFANEIPPLDEQQAFWEDIANRWASNQTFEPKMCHFEQLIGDEARPITNNVVAGMFDAAQRNLWEERYRCIRHQVHPQVWATFDAYDRRFRAVRDRIWIQDNMHTAHGRWRPMWRRRRPAVRSLHNNWPMAVAR